MQPEVFFMNEKFSSIMELQEREDKSALSEKVFRQNVLKEFSNGALILSEADSQGFTFAGFMRRGAAELRLTFVPMRTAEKFSVKKHTSAQRPYRHAHDFYELVFAQSGTCRQKFDAGYLTLSEGEMCLIPPDVAHSIERCGKDDVILKIIVPKPLFSKTATKYLCTESVQKFSLTSEAEYIISKLAAEEFINDDLHAVATESYLSLLFTEISRAENCGCSSLELSIRKYFSINVKDAALEDFAKKLGYNCAYLSRLIKNKTGRSFTELLTEQKIKAAQKLLAETDMTVADIAAETGYANPSGFYRQFVSCLGITPADYRKTLR